MLDRTDLESADLRRSFGDYVNFAYARMDRVDAQRVRWRGRFDHASLRGADLRRASIAGSLFYADLSGADLRGATIAGRLDGANLAGADLRGAIIACKLGNANLAEAKLEGTDFTGADLSEVQNLTSPELERACGEPSTRLPQAARIRSCKHPDRWLKELREIP